MKTILKSTALLAAAAAFAIFATGCTDEEHDHGQAEHDHADHEHAEHDHADDEGEHDHAHGEDGHTHDRIEDGPNGGRLLTSIEPHLEFFVTEDRKVRISSVTDDKQLQPIGDEEVSVIGGDRSNPTRMSFAKEGDVLVSNIAFPEGNDFPVVVQITSGDEFVTEKFNLNLADCPTCDNLEYACTCDHAH